jgi:hypothetical protein
MAAAEFVWSDLRPERQLTTAPHGHILTNSNVWSPDGEWIVNDVRSDPAGTVFNGTRIEAVHVESGEVRVLYESHSGACCGAASFCPTSNKVIFIHGPENPTPDWQYCAWHRRGVVVEAGVAMSRPASQGLIPTKNLDARDLVPPFTSGALRGGTHLHIYSPDGEWIAFTYEDHLLANLPPGAADADLNQRNVGVCVPHGPVRVKRDHPRNHDGTYFSVLVTQTVNQPRPGSDEISRACEEAWIGTSGYLRADGARQRRALAFQGTVVTKDRQSIAEAFLIDLPDDLTQAGEGHLAGTATRRPFPPKGVAQRRLSYTADRKYPGLRGPRHWLRSSPDGSRIAMLMKDDAGFVQLWTISATGGDPRQLTQNASDIASAFTWSPDGRSIAHVLNRSVCITDAESGQTRRITPRQPAEFAPRPEACVYSPQGDKIAYVRPAISGGSVYNQIFIVPLF